MESKCLTVHSLYGTIYHEGEFVQRGAVVGLSPDARQVVIAPISGWVRLRELQECVASRTEAGLHLEIWRDSENSGFTPAGRPLFA